MIVAILFLLIPRLYLSQEYEPWTRIDPDKPAEPNFFKYFIGILPLVFSKLSWLWFLLVLFEVQIINFSIIIWLKRRKAKEAFTFDDTRLLFIHGLTLFSWLVICVSSVDPDDGVLLAKALAILAIFYVGLALSVKTAYYGMLVGPLASIVMTT